jgi:methylated-DNA-[protein]-cysteine S-methyltransferase
MKQAVYAIIVTSPIGELTLTSDGKALTAIYTQPKTDSFLDGKKDAVLAKAKKQLAEYFSGTRNDFDVPMNGAGTPFQKKVWRALAKIPFGKTASYKDVAAMVGQPNAARAVGTANGKNPICIMVPCHRVISHDGSLGGYTGGLSKKRYLLSLEAEKI